MNLPLTIKETQEVLLSKKFSAVELVDSYLERIDKHNSTFNIFLTVTKEEAYKEAKKVDNLIKIGDKNLLKNYPLLGVTVAYKDLFLTRGIRTTAASKMLDSYVPEYSSTFYERLSKAGALILGKTNCDAWAHGASGENSDYGPTKNPWNKEYVAGGSSSGSAAAVSANLTLIASGTDTGGSIREPANFCGVLGLKPTYGAVSRYGVIAMASSLDSVGHMARNTSDIEKVYNIARDLDGKDSTLKETNGQSPKKKMRIGLPKEYFVEGIDGEVSAKVIEAAKIFEKEGVEIVNLSLPHTKYGISVYYIIAPAEVSSNLGRYDGVRYGNSRGEFGNEAKRRIMLGTYVLSSGYYDAYYLKAMKVRTLIIRDFDEAFSKVDAILAPVSPSAAFKIGEKAEDPLKMYLGDILTVNANLAGIPGISLPFGLSKKGLPLGFQLMGPRFSENVLFNLGNIFERATDYRPIVPKI